MVKVNYVWFHKLEKFGKGFDQLITRNLMPLIVVVAAEEHKLALSAVEPCDLGPALVEGLERWIHRGQQYGRDTWSRFQAFEELVADLLGATANQFWVVETDKEDFHRGNMASAIRLCFEGTSVRPGGLQKGRRL